MPKINQNDPLNTANCKRRLALFRYLHVVNIMYYVQSETFYANISKYIAHKCLSHNSGYVREHVYPFSVHVPGKLGPVVFG